MENTEEKWKQGIWEKYNEAQLCARQAITPIWEKEADNGNKRTLNVFISFLPRESKFNKDLKSIPVDWWTNQMKKDDENYVCLLRVLFTYVCACMSNMYKC